MKSEFSEAAKEAAKQQSNDLGLIVLGFSLELGAVAGLALSANYLTLCLAMFGGLFTGLGAGRMQARADAKKATRPKDSLPPSDEPTPSP